MCPDRVGARGTRSIRVITRQAAVEMGITLDQRPAWLGSGERDHP